MRGASEQAGQGKDTSRVKKKPPKNVIKNDWLGMRGKGDESRKKKKGLLVNRKKVT